MMRSVIAGMILAAFSATAFADASKWDVKRTSAPESVDELKALQTTVKAMVEKTTPATLAVFYEVGAGSGVIVSEDGFVLTAAHVVTRSPLAGFGGFSPKAKESDKVTLQLADGTKVRGKVLGRNGRMDSAMIKITDPVPKNAKWAGAENGKWPAVAVGQSTDLKKGQWVVSLGHPGGPKTDRRAPVRLGQMMTVTETGRRISSDCTLVGGDSGGPLFDLDGKLIGIHSSIGNDLTQNFHVPIHGFLNEWKRLQRGDTVGARSEGWLGIVLAGDDEGKKDRGQTKPIIEEVGKDSPAENAGLQKGDLILEFKGQKVASSEDIDQMMMGAKVGENILIKLRRGEDVYELEATLAKRPAN